MTPDSDGIRFAFGTLTVLPVRVTRWDRDAARAGMLCAPLAGLVVGLFAAAAGGVLTLLGSGPLLAAVATVAVPAALTRGLHLDGLADTADGLGSGKPAEDALRIMKQSDIGPFGVITLLFVLLAQVAALAELYGRGLGVRRGGRGGLGRDRPPRPHPRLAHGRPGGPPGGPRRGGRGVRSRTHRAGRRRPGHRGLRGGGRAARRVRRRCTTRWRWRPASARPNCCCATAYAASAG